MRTSFIPRRPLVVLVLVASVAGMLSLASPLRTSVAGAASVVPSYDHIVEIVMENHSYSDIIGDTTDAPYLNQLATQGAVGANYFAITHPSLPNYLALTGGDDFGYSDDCSPATACTVNAPNLADRLEAAGKSWKAYLESMPSACTLDDSYPYAVRHNPFTYYADMQNNSSRCQAHDVAYSQLSTDLASSATTPNFAFVVPNLLDDMHDGSVHDGDTWLSKQVPSILNSPAFTQQHSLLVIVWDEDDDSQNNQVPLLMLGTGVRSNYASSVSYTHYSLLATIEASWGLSPLTSNDANAPAMTDFFQSNAPASPTPTATATRSPTATATASSTPTDTPTDTPTAAPTDTPTDTPTAAPTDTPTDTPTADPTDTPTPTPTDTPTPTPTPTSTSTAGVPAYDHIVEILMENHSYSDIIGDTTDAPYLNQLATQGAVGANYFAITHPSLPNYLALTGGDEFDESYDFSNCGSPTTCTVNAPNLADRLEAAGKSWKAYLESMPSACDFSDAYPYAADLNPFTYYADMQNNSSRCQRHDVAYSQFASDLASSATTPNFAFVVPNLLDDMHDGSVSDGDTWLSQQVPTILNSPAFTQQRSLLVIVWDEDDDSQNNQVPVIFLGSGVRSNYASSVSYTHYSLLATIEASWGLSPLTSNDANAPAMTDFFQSGATTSPARVSP